MVAAELDANSGSDEMMKNEEKLLAKKQEIKVIGLSYFFKIVFNVLLIVVP